MKKLSAALFLLGLASAALAQGVDPTTQYQSVFPGADGGSTFVRLEPTQIFWDDFGTGTLDVTNRWATPTTGGGGNATAATNAVGATVLGSGNVASGWSILQSQPTFPGRNPGYVVGQWQVNFEFPALTNAYRFWGFATIPGSPTTALPLTNAVGFAVDTTGKLRAQTWASGAKNFDADLSIQLTGYQLCNCIPQPTDSGVHKYQITFRGDNILWWVDNRLVAKVLTGAGGPDVNTLPVAALAVAGATPPSSTAIVQLNQVTIGDSSRNNTRVCDSTFNWRCVSVNALGNLGGSGGFPASATAISGNATGTTGSVVGTLAAAAGKTTYICGFNVQAIGGTAAVGPITIAGLIGSSQVYQASASAAGGTVATQTFTPCIPASAVNTAITTTTTADGTATAVDVNSWGYQQ